jgi:hypothetical protein
MPEPAYSWSWEERLFVLYLLVVFLIASIKSLSVARQLLWFSAKIRASSENPGNGVSDAYALAASALANRLSWDFLGHDWNISAGGQKVEASSHLLPPAERTFRYAWERCSAKVSSLKRLVVLTLLSSVLILAYRTATILMVISYLPAVRARTLSGSLAEALLLFVLGLLTGTVLYAATSLCEGALSQRRALWDYFCRTIKDQQSTEMTAEEGGAEFLSDLP